MTDLILVVEDEEKMRKDIVKILKINNYNVIEADDGETALDTLKNNPNIKLVISDIMMSNMSGLALFREFKKDLKFVNIPFIFLTALTHPVDVNTAQSQGVDVYIKKPFDIPNLLSHVEGQLEKSKRLEKSQEDLMTKINQKILMMFSHEFRTPLTLVVAYSDMLSEWDKGLSIDEAEQFLNGVRSGANRLHNLVENIVLLIELSTDQGNMKYDGWAKNLSLDELDQIINSSIINAEFSYEDADITWDGVSSPIHGYDEYLSKMFKELIDNALKFSTDKVVTINSDQNKSHWIVSISNKSHHIPNDDLKKIFNPFYQYDRETHEFQGIGVGLSIVKGVADLHGASIDVSQDNEHITITIKFPLL